jgi:hypothetical protein
MPEKIMKCTGCDHVLVVQIFNAISEILCPYFKKLRHEIDFEDINRKKFEIKNLTGEEISIDVENKLIQNNVVMQRDFYNI